MLRRGLLFAALCIASGFASAEEALPLASIDRQGYAFEYPRVLVRQKMFGIAHGVALLADACRSVPSQAQRVENAYAVWRDVQHDEIAATEQELKRFYFGPRAAEARYENVVRALNLREALDFDPASARLEAACATLPDVLKQVRYDLHGIFQLEQALTQTQQAKRIETQVSVCGDRMSEEQRNLLVDRYGLWWAQQSDVAAAARDYLNTHWQTANLDGTPEQWLALQTTRYANPPPARCQELADWLLQSPNALNDSFALPPDPAAPTPAEAMPAEAVATPIQRDLPNEVAPNPAASKASSDVANDAREQDAAQRVENNAEDKTEESGNPLADLFDYIMKVLNDPTPKPARSQRAYP